ncbi:hypothetical protein E4U43_005979, partial [Claviceps pusilla]
MSDECFSLRRSRSQQRMKQGFFGHDVEWVVCEVPGGYKNNNNNNNNNNRLAPPVEAVRVRLSLFVCCDGRIGSRREADGTRERETLIAVQRNTQ